MEMLLRQAGPTPARAQSQVYSGASCPWLPQSVRIWIPLSCDACRVASRRYLLLACSLRVCGVGLAWLLLLAGVSGLAGCRLALGATVSV
jgi:hypothetical protein